MSPYGITRPKRVNILISHQDNDALKFEILLVNLLREARVNGQCACIPDMDTVNCARCGALKVAEPTQDK